MRKKVTIIICIIISILLISSGIYIIPKLLMKFPDGAVISDKQSITEDGMYYIKAGKLYFLDAQNNASTVVCNKANCNHDNKDCYAYCPGLTQEILYYNGYIYVSDAWSEHSFDDGEVNYTCWNKIYQIKADGSRRRNIYSSEEGSITQMKLVDGLLYFVYYKYPNGYKVNEWVADQYLYSYDLRWNKLEEVACIKADDEQVSSILNIQRGNTRELYLTYKLSTENKNTVILYKYDNGLSEIEKFDSISDIDFVFNENRQYMAIRDYQNDMVTLYTSTDFMKSRNKVLEVSGAWIDYMDDYMHIIKSDYSKIMLEYDTGQMYIANTMFTQEGSYISDIYNTDIAKNRIYIDAHDYTGISPGTILYEDASEYAVMKLDEFMGSFYEKWEDIDSKNLDKMDGFKIYE